MTYQEFKANFPAGSTVSSPEGKYPGQCVSYVRQYMALVHGIQTGPLGNAVDFATNTTFLEHYEKVANPQVGDIMIWGDDPGTWTGQYGHIAIFDGNGYMMNQNFNGSLKVSRSPIFTPGFIGYYRLKGGNMSASDAPADATYIIKEYSVAEFRKPSQAEIDQFLGKPAGLVQQTFIDSAAHKQNQFKVADYDRLAKELADLKAKVDTSTVATELKPGTYVVKG